MTIPEASLTRRLRRSWSSDGGTGGRGAGFLRQVRATKFQSLRHADFVASGWPLAVLAVLPLTFIRASSASSGGVRLRSPAHGWRVERHRGPPCFRGGSVLTIRPHIPVCICLHLRG